MSTNNVLQTNADFGQVFGRIGHTDKGSYTNGTGDDVTILAGTVLGKITSTGKLLPLKSDATNGSQIPMGIQLNTVTVADGDTVDIHYVVEGDATKDKLVFALGGDTLDTVINQIIPTSPVTSAPIGRMGDVLQRNTQIHLVQGVENTAADNTAS